MRALVFGYHTMGCLGFEALRNHGFEIVAVFTHRDDPGEEIWWESLAAKASINQVPAHTPEDPKSRKYLHLAASYRPQVIFSFYYRYMIPVPVLELAEAGAFNLHGSLLPRYRGRAPVNWVLVNGETETGVSLHRMVAKPDAGDLVDQEKVPIAFEDTAYTLFKKLEVTAGTLLDRALPLIREGRTPGRPMDLAAGSYFSGRKPDDGRIDWSWPASRIYDLVRAVTHPYPGAFTSSGGRKLFVWWALPETGGSDAPPGTVLKAGREGVLVAAGTGRVRLLTLQRQGEPELPASALSAMGLLQPGTKLGDAGDEVMG